MEVKKVGEFEHEVTIKLPSGKTTSWTTMWERLPKVGEAVPTDVAQVFERLVKDVATDALESRPASSIEQRLLDIASMIEEVLREQKTQPTPERQAALATISVTVRELGAAVETAHILGK